MAIPQEMEIKPPMRAWIAWPGITFRALAISIRPHQWVKNLLVFGGLIFSKSLLDLGALALSTAAFAAFCLASSSIYLLNDLKDMARDRQHPVKRFRPLASGQLRPWIAWLTCGLLFTAAMSMALFLHVGFAKVLVAYFAVNLAYTMGLKHIAILDVLLLSVGFVLRAVGGATAIGVDASHWLILCTLLLATYVALGKRRHELSLLENVAHKHRASLEGYSEQLLDIMMAMSGGTAILAYALYTMAEGTADRFGGRQLVLTTPFVIYGVFRFLVLAHKRQDDGDPASLLPTDPPSVLNILLWGATVCFLIYAPLSWLPR